MTLSKRRVSPWFLLALLLFIGLAAFRIVGVFLSYVLFGLFLAYLTYPVYAWILRRVRRPSVAATLMLVLMVIAVLVPLAFLLAQLVTQVQNVVASAGVADPQAILDQMAHRINALLGLPPQEGDSPGSSLVNDVYDNVQDTLTHWVRALPRQLAEGVIGVFLLAYVLFYAYTDGARWIQALREILPMQADHRETLFREVGHVIRGVMYGTILMSALQAALAAIGFYIFGVPNVALWSVLVFILALLPIVGAPMIWLPWGLYLIYVGETFNGAGLLLYSALLVNGLEHVIRPKLIGSVADIHPLLVLLGVVGGLAVFGFIGFILGPLILSVFMTVLNLYRKEFAKRLDAEALVSGPT
ncbi:MAG: AI-2E family transporter [Candidatus Thermoplasmatota archaeon]